jgi:DNA-binding SARP family transcriptional activator/predicted ATPase
VTGGAWRFGVLGPLVLELDGAAVAVASGRQRSLLALLLHSAGAPLSRDRLIDELWGEHPPVTAVSALHVHLSKLRALLGGLLLLGPAGYALTPADYELDVERFTSLLEQARADPTRAGALLRDALALFRGEPLCDVACEGSVSEWRRELEQKRVQTTLWRLDVDLADGGAAELVAELERLVAGFPFEERAWGQLMLALHRAGRQADALEAYQRARRMLASELGLDPSEQLTRLQQRILEADPTLMPAAWVFAPPTPQAPPTPPGPSTLPERSSLPRPLTRLVARERELEALGALIVDPDVRLIADGLAGYLSERELLLAIDNFEHLLDAAALVAELLALASTIRVLVSSRTALRIRGEQTFEVEPLELPADESEAEAAESPAVQLFIQCARAANRGLRIDASTTQTIAQVCRALDGLPLAIELAASRSQSLSPAQIADQLAQPLLIGERALRDLPDRQQSLEATIRWSDDLLSAPSRDALPKARAFALEQLSAAGGAAEAQTRHRRYFAALVEPASEAFDEGGAPGEIAEPLLPDHANLRAALEDAIETGDQASAQALGLGLRPLWLAGMLRQEGQEMVDRLLERFALPGDGRWRSCARSRFSITAPARSPGIGGWQPGRRRSATSRRSRWQPAICSVRR